MNAVDTNILVYAVSADETVKGPAAMNLLDGLSASDTILLWQVACEFIAASHKLAAHGLTLEEAWAQLTCYLDVYRLVVPGPAVLEQARELHLQQHWSFWDAMVVAACLDSGVTRLYSEDLPGRAPPQPLEIVNPFA